MTTLLSDNFNKTDSTTGVGDPQVGPSPFYYSTSVLGISGNRLYRPSGTLADARVFWDLNEADHTVTTEFTVLDSDPCLCFRVVDTANFWLVRNTGTNMQLYTCTAGGFAQQFDSGSGYMAAGDKIQVRCKGEYFQIYKNDTPFLTWRSRTFMTGDGVGIRIASSNTLARFDYITAEDTVSVLGTSTGHVYKGRDVASADTYGAA